MYSGKTEHGIELKTPRELELLRVSGCIAFEILSHIKDAVAPGVSTLELEQKARSLIKKKSCRSAFLGYRGYPAAICISLNHEVVHGIPSAKRVIRDGDIVSIDIGIVYDGYCGDNAVSVIAGTGTRENAHLLETAHNALYEGIRKALVGGRLGDICAGIQHIAESQGYSVVRDFVGHGIGRRMHEPPQIPNFGVPGTGPRLEAGMVLALEPMVNMGGYAVKVLSDGWTVVTADRKNSAHFEHMIAITDNGPEILTKVERNKA